MAFNKKPALATVLNELVPIEDKWQDIGIQLSIEDDLLQEIEKKPRSTRSHLREMIRHWLETDTACWRDLIRALRTRLVSEESIALEMSKRHCISEYRSRKRASKQKPKSSSGERNHHSSTIKEETSKSERSPSIRRQSQRLEDTAKPKKSKNVETPNSEQNIEHHHGTCMSVTLQPPCYSTSDLRALEVGERGLRRKLLNEGAMLHHSNTTDDHTPRVLTHANGRVDGKRVEEKYSVKHSSSRSKRYSDSEITHKHRSNEHRSSEHRSSGISRSRDDEHTPKKPRHHQTTIGIETIPHRTKLPSVEKYEPTPRRQEKIRNNETEDSYSRAHNSEWLSRRTTDERSIKHSSHDSSKSLQKISPLPLSRDEISPQSTGKYSGWSAAICDTVRTTLQEKKIPTPGNVNMHTSSPEYKSLKSPMTTLREKKTPSPGKVKSNTRSSLSEHKSLKSPMMTLQEKKTPTPGKERSNTHTSSPKHKNLKSPTDIKSSKSRSNREVEQLDKTSHYHQKLALNTYNSRHRDEETPFKRSRDSLPHSKKSEEQLSSKKSKRTNSSLSADDFYLPPSKVVKIEVQSDIENPPHVPTTTYMHSGRKDSSGSASSKKGTSIKSAKPPVATTEQQCFSDIPTRPIKVEVFSDSEIKITDTIPEVISGDRQNSEYFQAEIVTAMSMQENSTTEHSVIPAPMVNGHALLPEEIPFCVEPVVALLPSSTIPQESVVQMEGLNAHLPDSPHIFTHAPDLRTKLTDKPPNSPKPNAIEFEVPSSFGDGDCAKKQFIARKCTKCKRLPRRPKRSKCCQLLHCEPCSEDPLYKLCSVCGRKQSFKLDSELNNKIPKLTVYCKHNAGGCKWKGKMYKLKEHLLHECEIPCPYSSFGCQVMVTNANYRSHVKESALVHLELYKKSCAIQSIGDIMGN